MAAGHALSGHIPHDHHHLLGVAQDDIEVATNLTGGLEPGVDIEPGAGQLAGDVALEDAGLYIAGDAHLAGDFFFHGIGIGLGGEVGLDAGPNLEGLKRLGEVIVAANLEAAGLVLDILQAGEEHDGDVAVGGFLTQQAADLEPVDAWHDHIQHDEVGRGLVDGPKGGLAREGDTQAVVALEHLDEGVDIRFGVIDYENPGFRQVDHGSFHRRGFFRRESRRVMASSNS